MRAYYEDSLVRLYHGDGRGLFGWGMPDLILTDPQYQLADGTRANSMGASTRRGRGKMLGGTPLRNRDWGRLSGDEKAFEPEWMLGCPQVILWGSIHYANRLPNSTRWLVWDKRDGRASDDNADCEMAWTNLGGPSRVFRHLWKGVCRAGEENISRSGAKLHPFQKPVALMAWCLAQVPEAGIVADPYCGSGTTLVAARRAGRRAVGFEIEERICEVAARRLSREA